MSCSSQEKGDTSTLQTGKVCYYTVNVHVLMDVQNCKGAQSLVTHGTPKSLRGVSASSYYKSYIQQCMLRQDTLTVLQVHIYIYIISKFNDKNAFRQYIEICFSQISDFSCTPSAYVCGWTLSPG